MAAAVVRHQAALPASSALIAGAGQIAAALDQLAIDGTLIGGGRVNRQRAHRPRPPTELKYSSRTVPRACVTVGSPWNVGACGLRRARTPR